MTETTDMCTAVRIRWRQEGIWDTAWIEECSKREGTLTLRVSVDPGGSEWGERPRGATRDLWTFRLSGELNDLINPIEEPERGPQLDPSSLPWKLRTSWRVQIG